MFCLGKGSTFCGTACTGSEIESLTYLKKELTFGTNVREHCLFILLALLLFIEHICAIIHIPPASSCAQCNT